MKKFFVYIVQCSDGTLYTGMTTDVQKRVDTHNRGKGAKYTRSRLPVGLMWHAEAKSKSHALRLERFIKGLKRHEKFYWIYKFTHEYFEQMRVLQNGNSDAGTPRNTSLKGWKERCPNMRNVRVIHTQNLDTQ